VPVAKMSGRGLGFSGGDARQARIHPGYRVKLSDDEFLRQVRELALCSAGRRKASLRRTARFYALRDVTATVSSLPLSRAAS